MKRFSMLLLLLTVALFGCDSKQKLSFESVESARKQANENAEYNAQAFRSSHAEYGSYSIQTRGDSTQAADCGQGDGWATIDLVKIENGTKLVEQLKCSTASAAIGCRTSADFKSSPYASEDGKCSTEAPFPVPKIQK